MEHAQAGFTRREFLKFIGSAVFVTAVGTETSCRDLPKNSPSLEEYLEQAKLTEDPIYRAASVIVMHDQSWAHGGIYKDEEKLYLMTQWHVVDDVLGEFKCIIPGLTAEGFSITTRPEFLLERPKSDPNVRFPLDGEVKEKVEEAVSKDILTPLSFYEGKLRLGDSFAIPMPHNGEISVVAFLQDLPFSNELVFRPNNGYVCSGFSGLPVLSIDKSNNLTSKSVGLLRVSWPDEGFLRSEYCSNELFFVKPHIKWDY